MEFKTIASGIGNTTVQPGRIVLGSSKPDWWGYPDDHEVRSVGQWFSLGGLELELVNAKNDAGNAELVSESGASLIIPYNDLLFQLKAISRPLQVGDWVVDEHGFCATITELRPYSVFIEQSGEVKYVRRDSVRRIRPPESATS